MIAAHNPHRDGVRKAAILVASLDPAVADRLLDQLDAEVAESVRAAAAGIGQLDLGQRRRVLDEFHRIGSLVPGKCPPGIELDGPLAEQLGKAVGPAEADVAEQSAPSDPPPFDFLRAAADNRLWRLLVGEQPQTIALVLAHLKPERAGKVLTHLPAGVRVEVVRRLANLDSADRETLREVEQALELRMSRQLAAEQHSRLAGPDAAAQILASCESGVADDILENLASSDQPLAERLGRRPPSFAELAALDDRSLAAVFRAAGPILAQAALLGAQPSLIERVLGGMTPADAKRWRRKLACPDPIRLSDVDAARQQIAVLARRMPRVKSRPASRAA